MSQMPKMMEMTGKEVVKMEYAFWLSKEVSRPKENLL
jgi:hypothetical protein